MSDKKPFGFYFMSENFSQMLKSPELTMKVKNFLQQELLRFIEKIKQELHKYRDNTESYIHSMHLQMDEIAKDQEKTNPHFKKIACKSGCSFCCFLNVDIQIDEAKLLLAHSENINYQIDWDRINKQAGKKDDWYALSLKERKCVFLSNEGTCSVYEYRPASCRNHAVISDPKICNTELTDDTKVMKYNIFLNETITSALFNVGKQGNMADMLLKAKP